MGLFFPAAVQSICSVIFENYMCNHNQTEVTGRQVDPNLFKKNFLRNWFIIADLHTFSCCYYKKYNACSCNSESF